MNWLMGDKVGKEKEKYLMETKGYKKDGDVWKDANDNVIDNKTVLDLEDDAAHVNMGGNWRMPTYDEFYELKTKCNFIYTTYKGVKGHKVVGPNGNSIFLPLGFFVDGTKVHEIVYSIYLTASLNDNVSNEAYEFFPFVTASTSKHYWLASNARYYGRVVRAVCE